MNRKQVLGAAMAAALAVILAAGAGLAQNAGVEGVTEATRAPESALPEAVVPDAAPKAKAPPRDPSKGAVTNLPIPRFVSLKGREGNARRGPGLTHRIDWVFTTAGTPLRITAEFGNWRRVKDSEGLGGWVHYSLLSGVRYVLVTLDLAEFRDTPNATARVAFQAERNVIGKLLECVGGWCRVTTNGETGWILQSALWGVDPGEVLQ